jgi:branched-subunit amino acid ABC-type transport system permease component
VSEFLSFAVLGIPYGCVFALMAIGLVLTYETSGVFNLAFGAQAYVAAIVFYKAVGAGWPKWLAFLVAVLVVSPAIGVTLDRILFRHVRTAPVLVKLISALGVLIAIPAAVQLVVGNEAYLAPPTLLFSPSTVYMHLWGVPINGTQMSIVIVTMAAVLGIALLFHFTKIGLRMRAMAESPRMIQLAGVDSEAVGALTWALSSTLAGLAGVLLAAPLGQINSLDFTNLLVAGIAAAAAGSLRSLPYTFFGGIGIGIAQQLLSGYLPSGSVLSSGMRYAFPFVALVVFLLVMPGLKHSWRRTRDPLAVVDPPPPPLSTTIRTASLDKFMRRGLWVVTGLFVVSSLTWVPDNWLLVLILGLAASIIFLSITVLTGMSGQISLCQMTFAGTGAFMAGQLAAHFNVSLLVGILIGAAAAAALGALIALPALRLGGLALAIATLAFGFLADNIGFQYSWAGNGVTGLNIPRPQLGPIDFNSDRAFFVLTLLVLLAVAGLVKLLGRGTTGRYLDAMRGSELASAAIGININRWKVVVFAFSAGIAGVGGAMYATALGSVSSANFNTVLSLVFMVVVVTTGVSTIEGAVQAGMAIEIVKQILTYLPSKWANLLEIIFGAGAITYALHPEGIVEYEKRRFIEYFNSFRGGRGGPSAERTSGRGEGLPDAFGSAAAGAGAGLGRGG